VAGLAGLTQTYGLIPFLVISGCYGIAGLVGAVPRHYLTTAVAASALAASITFVGQAVWAAIVPHATTPTQFGLLELGFGMAGFYASVWPIAYAPFLPVVVLVGVAILRRTMKVDLLRLSLLCSTAAFAALSFIYQWEESRLTFVYWPIVCLTLAAWCGLNEHDFQKDESSRGLLTSSVLALAVGVLVTPGDYWHPDVRKLRIAPGSTWLASILSDGPQDRLFLQTQCGGMANVCGRAHIEPQASPYRQQMMEEYRRRKTASQR
jgi:hypothetical protein